MAAARSPRKRGRHATGEADESAALLSEKFGPSAISEFMSYPSKSITSLLSDACMRARRGRG
eukprot:7436963-Pyramimonas_sp.AAC.1